jgi:PelA/Pel-15E family pectate lyase
MANPLHLWFDIVYAENHIVFLSDNTMKQNIQASLDLGIEFILDAQIYSKQQRMWTGWAMSYDRNTPPGGPHIPVWAREFEPPVINRNSTRQAIALLMRVENPCARVQKAVHTAYAFHYHVEIFGFTINEQGTSPWGRNRELVPDPDGARVWGGFICIDTFDTLFLDRVNPSFRTNPNESLTYRPATTGFLPGNYRPNGGNLRNLYDEDGNLLLAESYQNLSHERRTGYSSGYIAFGGDGTGYRNIRNTYGWWHATSGELRSGWLFDNNLTIPVGYPAQGRSW